MVTYLYWLMVLGSAAIVLLVIGRLLGNWTIAIASAAAVLVIGWAAYFFHYQNIFVKRYGGVMSITVPAGQHHISATWKDDNLWVENYDPATNTCIFSEYSRGNLLQGRVIIKQCNPLMPMK